MPIIASETIHIDVKKDRSIEVMFLNDLQERRCINIASYASGLNGDKDQLLDTVERLVGEKTIECNSAAGICCLPEDYHSFVNKLNGLKQ